MQRFDRTMHDAYTRAMQLSLSAEHLAAFAEIASSGSFTRAARTLHLSQPALSRRISALEQALEVTLLARGRHGATVTEAGRRLLDFVAAQRALEEDLIGDLRPATATYRGVIRIAGLSSLVTPVVVPALAPFLRAHADVQLEVHRDVDRRAVDALAAGRVDLALSQGPSGATAIVDVPLGDEEYVMVESRRYPDRRDVFLDVGPSDETTAMFLAPERGHARRPARLRRSFLHDEAGILMGVELGLGRAVKPRHSIPRGAAVRIDRTFAPQRRPVFLHYRRQAYYGRLHQAVTALIEEAVRRRLEPATRSRRS
jgi:DNA-binding transcriptional LysR family regulator